MRILLLLVSIICLVSVPLAGAAPFPDVLQSPSCRYCGMDRAMFSHSRMVIEYEDGSNVATCSLHCAAIELANTIDKSPRHLLVADYDTKALIDAEKATWVLGGSKKGVMTRQAKWAFADKEAAERFIQANGGNMAGFEEAIRAAYDDMYLDTRMIREMRKMKRMKHQGGTVAP